MPDFMQIADRIVGGKPAPSMIPWQVWIEGCGGTILDSCTILTAAHCGINTGHSIRAGSTDKTSGGQVIVETLNRSFCTFFFPSLFSSRFEAYHKLYQTQIFHMTHLPPIMIGLLPNWILH